MNGLWELMDWESAGWVTVFWNNMAFAIMNTQQVRLYACSPRKEREWKRREKSTGGKEEREREEQEDMRISGSRLIEEGGSVRTRRGERVIRRDCNHITLCNHDANIFKI